MTGAGIGAFTGAMIAGARGAPGPGAIIGGAIGAMAGGLIGHSIDEQQIEQQQERLRYQAPQTYVRVEQNQPLSLTDVKALAAANVGDEVIISQIRNSHSVYHLGANEIIELQNAGVSEAVINFMINTPTNTGTTVVHETGPVAGSVVAEEPPAPRAEVVIAAPGPGYIWLPGEWTWNHRWVWVSGRWVLPPHPHAVWVRGYWQRHTYGWRHVPGHWG